MSEQIAKIAKELRSVGKEISFSELADRLGQDHRLMAQRVGKAWKDMHSKGRFYEADCIQLAFTNDDGSYAWYK